MLSVSHARRSCACGQFPLAAGPWRNLGGTRAASITCPRRHSPRLPGLTMNRIQRILQHSLSYHCRLERVSHREHEMGIRA